MPGKKITHLFQSRNRANISNGIIQEAFWHINLFDFKTFTQARIAGARCRVIFSGFSPTKNRSKLAKNFAGANKSAPTRNGTTKMISCGINRNTGLVGACSKMIFCDINRNTGLVGVCTKKIF